MRIIDKILNKGDGSDFSDLEKLLGHVDEHIKYSSGQPYASHRLNLIPPSAEGDEYKIQVAYSNKHIADHLARPGDITIEYNRERTDEVIAFVISSLGDSGIKARKSDFADKDHTGDEISFVADSKQFKTLIDTIKDKVADGRDTVSEDGISRYLSNTDGYDNKFDYKHADNARKAVAELIRVLKKDDTEVGAEITAATRRTRNDIERTLVFSVNDPDSSVEEGLKAALGEGGITVDKKGNVSKFTINVEHQDNKGFGGVMRHARAALREHGIDLADGKGHGGRS